jgi:antitoxin (DNA-binding transcriptional repressor) of toxin-antitoxin stability system
LTEVATGATVDHVNVGTKQLKNRLSHYLRQVRAGQVVHVTDRGKVIAEIRAVEQAPLDDVECLRQMEASGLVSVGSGRFEPFKPVRLRGRVRASRAVLDDRG